MKKVLGTMLAVGLMAASANAATLSIVWSSTGTTMQDALASDSVSIDVVVDLIAGETLSTVGFTHGAQPLLTHVSVTGLDATLTDVVDNAGVGDGSLGSSGEQVGFASPNPLASSLSGPGTFVLGSYAVHVNPSATPSDNLEVTFDGPATTNMLQQSGAAMSYVPGFATTLANFYGFGTGSPDTGVAPTGQPADPLLLHVLVPEPASLSLLALGGLAALRRRR